MASEDDEDEKIGPLNQIRARDFVASVAGFSGLSVTASPLSDRRKSVQTGAPAIGFRPVRRFERRASQPTLKAEHIAKAHETIRAGLSSVAPKGVASTPEVLEDDELIEPVIFSAGAPFGIENRTGEEGATTNNHVVKRGDTLEEAEEESRAKMLSKRVSWLSMKSLQETVEPLLNIKSRIRRSSGQGSPTNTTSTTVNVRGSDSQYGSAVQLNEDLDMDSDTPPLDTLSWSFAGWTALNCALNLDVNQLF